MHGTRSTKQTVSSVEEGMQSEIAYWWPKATHGGLQLRAAVQYYRKHGRAPGMGLQYTRCQPPDGVFGERHRPGAGRPCATAIAALGRSPGHQPLPCERHRLACDRRRMVSESCLGRTKKHLLGDHHCPGKLHIWKRAMKFMYGVIQE